MAASHPAPPRVVLKDPKLVARLLYPNPVCFLSTHGNVMIISWITASNNAGGVLLSMNKKRHTAEAMAQPGAVFTLSVACAGLEELVLAVGSCSGRDGDKFEALPDLQTDADFEGFPPSIRGSVASMHCRVASISPGIDDYHWSISAQVVHATVLCSHWNGKVFGPVNENDKRFLLTFLGSKRFGHVIPVASHR